MFNRRALSLCVFLVHISSIACDQASQLTSLKEELEHLHDSLASCKLERASLKKQLEHRHERSNCPPCKTECEEDGEDLRLLQLEQDLLQERMSVCSTHLKNSQNRENVCKKELESTKSDLSTALKRSETAEDVLDSCDDLESELSAAGSEKTLLKDRIRSLEEKLNDVMDGHQEVKAELQEAQAAKAVLQGTIGILQQRVDDAVAKADSLGTVQGELYKAQSDARIAAAAADAARAAREHAEKQVDNVLMKIDALVDTLSAREKYEVLLLQHSELIASRQSEWLPYWLHAGLKTRVKSARTWVANLYVSAGEAVHASYHRALQPAASNLMHTGVKFYKFKIIPVFEIIEVRIEKYAGSLYPKTKQLISQGASKIGKRAQELAKDVEEVLLMQMSDIPVLAPFARTMYIRITLCFLFVVFILLPLALRVLHKLFYRR